MHTTAEPLSGLIEFMAWSEDGTPIVRFRYYSLRPHGYRNGHFAGRFADGVYSCALPDGTKVIEADGANGVGLTLFDEHGAPALAFRTVGPVDGRCEIEAASGKFFAWHPNGRLAVIATFSQAMYDAWNIQVRVSPSAALSPFTHASLRACVEPWLETASSRHPDLATSMHAERGLTALRASSEIEMATILSLMVLLPPTLDHDASLLCQMLMSSDPAVRARPQALLDSLGPDSASAAIRLALMKQEDRNASVQDWVAAALLRLGGSGLAMLQEVNAGDTEWHGQLQSTIDWLQANVESQ